MILRKFEDADLVAELRARGFTVLSPGRVREVKFRKYLNVFDAQQLRDVGGMEAFRERMAHDLAQMTATFILTQRLLPITEEEEPGSLRVAFSTKLAVIVPGAPEEAPPPRLDARPQTCEARLFDEGQVALDGWCRFCSSRDRAHCPHRPTPVRDLRPANCRNRLADEGSAHPKSGCDVPDCHGVFGPACHR